MSFSKFWVFSLVQYCRGYYNYFFFRESAHTKMLVLQQIDGLSCCWVHSHHTTKSAAAKFLVTLLGPHRCSSSCSSVQPVTQALQYIVYIYIFSVLYDFVWLVGFIPTPAYRKIFPLSLPPKEKKPRWKQQFSSVSSSSSVSKFGEAAMADDSSTPTCPRRPRAARSCCCQTR